MQVKVDSKAYKAPPRHVLQETFKEDLEQLQEIEITAPIDLDETAEWHNSFIFVPKPNVKVRLCLHPARLNQVLIRPVHTGLTLSYIFPKLMNAKYLTLIDASLGYHSLRLDETLSCLIIFHVYLVGTDIYVYCLEQFQQA